MIELMRLQNGNQSIYYLLYLNFYLVEQKFCKRFAWNVVLNLYIFKIEKIYPRGSGGEAYCVEDVVSRQQFI
jgi:hypothetical protein